MILVYDTETTGLVHKHLPDSHPQQPHVVQLACILYEEDGTEVASVSGIVRPRLYLIPDAAASG